MREPKDGVIKTWRQGRKEIREGGRLLGAGEPGGTLATHADVFFILAQHWHNDGESLRSLRE